MSFDDALGDREADAHAGWLGGDERLKQARENFLGKAASRVGDPDLDHAFVQQNRFNHELLLRTSVHGFDRIADQIEENLLNLHLFNEDGARPRIEAEDRFNTLLLGADKGQGARFLNELVDALGPPLHLAARNELAQAADDLASAQRLVRGLGQSIVNLLRVRVLDALSPMAVNLERRASSDCSSSSWRSVAWRSVRSRMKPVKKRRSPDRTSPTSSFMGKVEPSWR
jgi:hypothetical protein